MDRGVSRPAGDPIASGRAADIYDAGPGRVMRRKRSGDIPAHEVTAMRHAHGHGYPVPEVFSVDGPEMVMERVDGKVLFDSLAEKPWRIRATGRLLADLHRRLAAIPIEGVEIRTMFGAPEALVHGDLHPGNVLGSADDPVVIDWGDATRGAPAADVARTWVLVRFGALPPGTPATTRVLAGVGRRILLRGHAAAYRAAAPLDQGLLARWQVVAAAARLWDPVPEDHPAVLRYVRTHIDLVGD